MEKEGSFQKVDESTNTRKMFPKPNVNEQVAQEHFLFVPYSCTTLSKRPVHCPYPGCGKTIAVNAVDKHFKYEHKLITSITTQYEARNELKINPSYLKTNQSTCIILVNIIDNSDSAVKSPFVDPTLLIMASNIMNIELQDDFEDNDYRKEIKDYSCFHFDNVIFWIASNIVTNSKYTLALSTLSKTIRIKYYGFLSQINESCLKLNEEGKGLILHHLQILKMTNHGQNPLSLDFIIHKEETND
ncbi:hypothetical protein FQA39_LY03801 [Lamprigera yunnana]|nr:hypothetical protein FQA39_LY03801 [Lamprigera yunnana]